ncbi:MAG: class I SAM-dependent methyltransferase [Actinomycetes bacterium]
MPDLGVNAQQMARLFDALSDTYDDVGVEFFGPIAASLADAMRPRCGESWLDIGCGRGAVIDQIADAVGSAGRVVGIDISPQMIERARSQLTARSIDHVELLVGDAMDPSPTLGHFDTISSCLVLFFLPEPELALNRWLSRLAPGGRIGVTTFGPVDPRLESVEAALVPYLPPTMRDARTSGRRGTFSSDTTMVDLLTRAGYASAHTVTDQIEFAFTSAQHWYDFSWSTGQRMMWMAMSEEQRLAARAQTDRRLAQFAQADGSIRFTQQIRHTLAVHPGG